MNEKIERQIERQIEMLNCMGFDYKPELSDDKMEVFEYTLYGDAGLNDTDAIHAYVIYQPKYDIWCYCILNGDWEFNAHNNLKELGIDIDLPSFLSIMMQGYDHCFPAILMAVVAACGAAGDEAREFENTLSFPAVSKALRKLQEDGAKHGGERK